MEPVGGVLTWRPLTAADFLLLAGWRRERQVARWWNHEHSAEAVERDFGASARGEESGEDLVVSLDGHPVGLLQRSAIIDYPEDLAQFSPLVDVPEGAVELDYLIADASLRGRGLGSGLLSMAVEGTQNDYPGARAELVAVVAANTASWRHWRRRGCSGSPKRR